MREPYEVIDEGDIRGEIFYDDDAESPRTFCDGWLGHMVCGHKNYLLGDEQMRDIDDDFSSWDEFEDYLIKERGAKLILPLSLYDHSGITMKIGHCRGWDTMPVGFIYATDKTLKEVFGENYKFDEIKQKAEEYLRSEVEEYDYYLTGQVYGFRVSRKEHIVDKCPHCSGVLTEHDDYVEIESSWGFYGGKSVKEEMKMVIDYARKDRQEKS